MHNLSFPLDAAVNGNHAGRQDNAALFLIERWPDYEIGDSGLQLQLMSAVSHTQLSARVSPNVHSRAIGGRIRELAIRIKYLLVIGGRVYHTGTLMNGPQL
jgi:hypothetical protein